MARFDLAEASQLESRDGGVSKGGLVRNGFVERDGEEVWSWQRPALNTYMAAPLVGSGLGLYGVGTVLWSMYHSGGTGGGISFRVGYTTSSSQLVAISTGNLTGYDNATSYGSLSPGTFGGATVTAVYNSTISPSAINLRVRVDGVTDPDFWTKITVGGIEVLSSSRNGFSGNQWFWTHLPVFSTGAGTYTFVIE